MALIYIDVRAACDPSITPCSNVYLCLTQIWDTRTISGFAFAAGRIVAINQTATPPPTPNPCCVGTTICPEDCIYQIEVNDNQFLIDPQTNEPYLITADDVVEIFPYACVAEGLINDVLTPITLQGDSGPPQTFNHGSTVSILGSGEVTTVASAPDTITVNVDSLEALIGNDELDNGGTIADVTAVGTYTIVPLGPIVINNPSPTKLLKVLYSIVHSAQISLGEDWEGSLAGETDINGGGFSTFDFDYRIGAINPITNHFQSWVYNYQNSLTIAGGGSATLLFRPRIHTYVSGSGTTTWASHFYKFNFIGVPSI